MLPLPRFAGEGRYYLLYYHAPIGMVFVAYLFDRAERFRAIHPAQWLIELPLIALALARTITAVPLISGHALFLTYTILTTLSPIARWIAVAVLLDVIYIKFTLQDVTLIGGVFVGILAVVARRWLVSRQLWPRKLGGGK